MPRMSLFYRSWRHIRKPIASNVCLRAFDDAELPAFTPGAHLPIPAQHSILDTLLDAGLAVAHGCKRGECSLCVTQVLAGEPDHRDLCLSPLDRENAMCVCVSRAKGESLALDL